MRHNAVSAVGIMMRHNAVSAVGITVLKRS